MHMKYICARTFSNGRITNKIYPVIFNNYISAKEKCDKLNKIDSDVDMWYPLPVYERDLY